MARSPAWRARTYSAATAAKPEPVKREREGITVTTYVRLIICFLLSVAGTVGSADETNADLPLPGQGFAVGLFGLIDSGA